VEFWRAKLESNRRRDLRANAEFVARGWLVVRFWEHELKEDPLSCAERLGSVLAGRISSRGV
jgi:DNA mismatch endonuclease (patch repair protein)